MALSFTDLEKVSGVDRKQLRQFEQLKNRGSLTIKRFHLCDNATIAKLEHALGCPNTLKAGEQDDFLSQYMMFYENHKIRRKGKKDEYSQLDLDFSTKVVIFDFDGTLTKSKDDNLTIWERIWEHCGYSVDTCAHYFQKFRYGEIDHEQWCKITADHFRKASFRKSDLREIGDRITLIDGVRETVERLSKEGITLYILSGSIKDIIWQVLGDIRLCFDEVKANELHFDDQGIISEIRGTRFDFEGKANFIKRVIEDRKCSPLEVLFIGNSCNDVWCSQAGARTLCVNPHFADPFNRSHWTYYIRKMSNLEQILRYTQLSSGSGAR